jgi:hypothetical protein
VVRSGRLSCISERINERGACAISLLNNGTVASRHDRIPGTKGLEFPESVSLREEGLP